MAAWRVCQIFVKIGALLLAVSGPSALTARGDPSALCVDAATEAAGRTGVPFNVLLAIAVVESGGDDRPWPWTVNVGGDGQWFDTADAAESHAKSVLDQGLTNVDLGCFQLNVRWHAKAFGSVSDMLDPAMNATYAAKFLARHYANTGDWAAAAAAYHSATPEHAERYRARFEETFAALDPRPPTAVPTVDVRENRFPLLVAGAAAGNGSLVPASARGLRLIGGN